MTRISPAGDNLRTAISAATWRAKYRRSSAGGAPERSIEDTWLTRFVRGPFSPQAVVDFEGIAATAAISKTINVPENLGFEAFCSLYEEAYALGLKGCTTFRPNPVTGSVLTPRAVAEAPAHCCGIEREAD
ncbi:MAG: hypothetical protein K2Y16_03920 [Burkholderiales bacterium]|nr:hypothetical protein [Burkholderiales bacterium]